jgi:hypothetical protein
MSCSHSAERTLVLAWHMLAAGRSRCPALRSDMEAVAGCHAMALLSAVEIFLVALGNSSRRRLAIGHPVCLHRTFDEQTILALIAAKQEGNVDRVAAHMRWLVLPGRREIVLETLDTLTAVAARANLTLAETRH